jgi:hypothetical protein
MPSGMRSGVDDDYGRHGLFYSLPITIGVFFRELFAVTLILVLQERAIAYDAFTAGLVLFLIFMSFRVPYINSYTLLFEALSLGQWEVKNHVGLRKHRDPMQNALHVLIILVAHVCGALGAAAVRVYLDVTYGTEVIRGKERDPFGQTDFAPALRVNVESLSRFDPFWGAEERMKRLAAKSANGTLMHLVPLSNEKSLGISDTSFVVWYMAEEIGFVFLLCVCYIHIWLAAGVGENHKPVLNPFRRNYWKSLFRVSVLVVFIYVALLRAFPTAHGSIHMTVFKIQYQMWNPNVRTVDDDHGEPFARFVGGFVGMLLAVGYNRMLVGTERANSEDDPGGYYYKMIWGLEPDPDHTRTKRVGRWDSEDNDDEVPRRGGASQSTGGRKRAVDDSDVGCKTFRVRHCEKGKCTDSTCTVCMNSDFKLRLPHIMDYAK